MHGLQATTAGVRVRLPAPADNLLHSVTLDGPTDIVRTRFTGGGNEGIINSIRS